MVDNYNEKLMNDILKTNSNFNMHLHNTYIDLLILWNLYKKDLHGYLLIKKIDEFFNPCIEREMVNKVSPKKVYSILYRMEDQGIIESYPSTNGKKKVRKYTLTEDGKTLLNTLRKSVNNYIKNDKESYEFLKFLVGNIDLNM